MEFAGDFETTTNEKDCRVWAWACCEVGNLDNVYMGTTIDSFMNWAEDMETNVRVLFHNLKWDGQFILSWLFKAGFKHVTEARDRQSNTFTTVISDKGMYYSIEVIFWRQGKRINKVTFWDSHKLFPMSVEEVSNAFKMPYKKLEIDYDAHNNLPYGAPLSKEEQDYIINDVRIMAYAIGDFRRRGLERMTIGACALHEYKSMMSEREFKRWFPPAPYHEDVKQAYRGGFSQVNKEFENKTLGNGLVLDVNSMFSYVMRNKPMPHGTPIFYKGAYKENAIYPLYTQMLQCGFKVKKGKIPTLQIRNSIYYSGSKYLTDSGDEELVLCLNSIDLELFLEHYDVWNLEYISGWMFKATDGLFDAYIDKWVANKIKAEEEENWGLRLCSKYFLNNLYGKFGSGIWNRTKTPYMSNDGKVHFKDEDPEPKEGVYIAVASFITSYARDIIIRASQRIEDEYHAGKSNIRWVYSDTDSLHILSPDFKIPEWINIHKTELGAFKVEAKFRKAKFIRPKCYIEDATKDFESEKPEYSLNVVVAGMPKGCHEQVTFRNFKPGASYQGKKQPQLVAGGVILKDVDFTIKV